MINIAELLGVAVFLAAFFTILFLYIRHRIWQKRNAMEDGHPFDRETNRFARSHQSAQLQYPNPGRIPSSYLGGPVPISDGVIGRQEYSRRFHRRYPNALRPPPHPIMVFTVAIPEEDEDQDAPPSYEDVIKQTPPPQAV